MMFASGCWLEVGRKLGGLDRNVKRRRRHTAPTLATPQRRQPDAVPTCSGSRQLPSTDSLVIASNQVYDSTLFCKQTLGSWKRGKTRGRDQGQAIDTRGQAGARTVAVEDGDGLTGRASVGELVNAESVRQGFVCGFASSRRRRSSIVGLYRRKG